MFDLNHCIHKKKLTFELNCIYIQGIIIITAVRREWKSWWASDAMILVFNGQKRSPCYASQWFYYVKPCIIMFIKDQPLAKNKLKNPSTSFAL